MKRPTFEQMAKLFSLLMDLNVSFEDFDEWLNKLIALKKLPPKKTFLSKKQIRLNEIFPKEKIKQYTSEKGMVQRVYNTFSRASNYGIGINQFISDVSDKDTLDSKRGLSYRGLGEKTRKIILEILKSEDYL
jgi:hypothetical protein